MTTNVQKIYMLFGMKSIEDCFDLHIQCDTLLQTDILEDFRETCPTSHKFELANFYFATGIAWIAAMKITKVQL